MRGSRTLLDDLLGGYRLSEPEALGLLKGKDRTIWEIVVTADLLRAERVGNEVTYVRNQNLHITNICKNLCGFCAFGRPEGAEGSYLYGKEEIQAQARNARERSVSEICLLSGVHPDFTLEDYADFIRWVREIVPRADIHTGSPDEIVHAAERSGLTIGEVLSVLRDAGMGTMQGTAAEILVDEVREVICPRKIDTETWTRVIREAHSMGIRSTATIMYGSVETPEDRIAHLSILRKIQDENGGFTELVPLPYLHQHTRLYREGMAPAGATGRTDILLLAVSRLFLDNFDNIQVSWGKLGLKMTQLCLLAGGNDLGGTMFCDDVSLDAGGEGSDYLDPAEMRRLCEDIGRNLVQRTTLYEPVSEI
ncbi:MAG: 5-amino-6-(D-ribitylamino)uracil--L-tyrosine 4-hydroxyphenyl transferase CofH [Methanomicrobiaceae archaeon]|nr:5-amino-6-(D-ribitylamino)uracil--L-tyrosine 4-hydroxyphenyl transferase CofH [Methanomicrobiaceae archaeon]